MRQGKRLMEIGFHLKALDKFNSIIEKDSSVSGINLLASYCYLELHEPYNALKLINQISYEDDCVNYYKTLCYYQLEKFDEANKSLQKVEEISCYFQLPVEELKDLIVNASANYKNSKGFLVRNFGKKINSKDREYCAVMLNNFDSVLFTTRRTDSHSVLAEDGMGYESIYSTNMDKDQSWSSPLELNLNTKSKRNHTATVQVISEGKEVIIFHNGDLHFAKKEKNEWIRQDRINAISKGYNETHCFLTPDNNTVYFSSDYLSDDNNFDLFVSKKTTDGVWSEPEALDELNTPYDEDAPFISGDGTFYFSSKGHSSIGGFDVFSTRFIEEKNSWTPVENMGHPINSVADDIYFNTHGKVGYISSSRLGGEGMLDLYQVLLFNKIRMRGKILSADSMPVPGATIDVAYGDSFFRAYSDYEGNYEMYVPIDKYMLISIGKDTINLHKGNYIVKASFGQDNENGYDFTTGLALSQDKGTKTSSDYKILGDTVSINLQVKNDLKKNDQITEVLMADEMSWLDSINALDRADRIKDSLQLLDEKRQKMQLDTIVAVVNFGFDSYQLTDSVKMKLENLVALISKTEYDQVDTNGYTDAVGHTKYNDALSLKRAQVVGEFLVNHGISSEKLVIKGLGENDLLENKEGKSAVNRRVELILKMGDDSQK